MRSFLSGKVFGTEADYIIAEAEFPEGEGEEPEEVSCTPPHATHIHTHTCSHTNTCTLCTQYTHNVHALMYNQM